LQPRAWRSGRSWACASGAVLKTSSRPAHPALTGMVGMVVATVVEVELVVDEEVVDDVDEVVLGAVVVVELPGTVQPSDCSRGRSTGWEPGLLRKVDCNPAHAAASGVAVVVGVVLVEDVELLLDVLLDDEEDEDDDVLLPVLGTEHPKVCSGPSSCARASGLSTKVACRGPHTSWTAWAGWLNITAPAAARPAATTAPRRVIRWNRVLKVSFASRRRPARADQFLTLPCPSAQVTSRLPLLPIRKEGSHPAGRRPA